MLDIRFVLYLIIFFLPYTNSLVLNIGFPLKIYEFLSIFLFSLLLLNLLMGKSVAVKICKYEKQIYLALLVFFIWYCLAGIAGIYNLNHTSTPIWAVGRYAPTISVITKLFYFLFNIILFSLVIAYINNKDLLLKAVHIWIISSFVVSIYTVYLFIGSIFNTHLFLLPGTQDMQYIVISGMGTFVRNSTFKEGNIFGGYMTSSLLITLPFLFIREKNINPFSSKIVSLVFFFQLFALFISYSTINILVFIISGLFFFKITYFEKPRIPKKPFYAIVLFGIVIVVFLFSQSGKLLFYQKLFGTDPFWSYSRKDRINMNLIALKMACDNPVFGVGPTNYGFYYNDYSIPSMRDTSIKRIAGNIYAEILCESGIIGLVSYVLLMFLIMKIFIVKKKYIQKNYMPVANALFCGFIGMLTVFLAFPTFTLTFHWVLMGLLISSIKALQIQ